MAIYGDLWRSEADRATIEQYYRDVSRITWNSYRDFKNQINPLDLPRNGKDYELDHKYSIARGFVDNIPPEIIGHWVNLEMLTASDNNAKWARCSISKEELLEAFNSSKDII